MDLRDNNGISRLKFYDITKISNESPVFVKLNVKIFLDFSESKEEIFVELSDLDELCSNLNSLYNNDIKRFYFQHLDDLIKICFTSESDGKIDVEGYLKDKSYTNTLNFKFTTYPIEILEFLTEIKKAIKKL